MPRIYLCFLWHMHQPFYKDLISGEYKLPWTRLHALKDYAGMVRILAEFPRVRQTFNLVPSMMVQVEEYAAGEAADPFLRCAMKPAEELTEAEHGFILHYFFQANPARMIYRYARYGELYDAWLAAAKRPERVRRTMDARNFRDLQVLSQLVWCDEELLEKDTDIRELVLKGRDYTREDQLLLGEKQQQALRAVLPAYRQAAGCGQIEISTTPFYHPILPLLCDSDIAGVAHPHVPLPSRFRYPEDARRQLERARQYMGERFGAAPAGLWPSEGSVSDEAIEIAAELDFRWAATDNGVLNRTLGHTAGVAEIYRPWLWRRDGRRLHLLFRDHFLSDLIGFVYSRMGSAEAAHDFLHRIRENCRSILAGGRDALVPIILDGENAWEYYERNGRPFLRELYRSISEDPQIEAVTVSEALARMQASELDHIFPGSWINANFDIWIGAEEDNQAWECLLRARQTYGRVANGASDLPEAKKKLAYEELLIAEGSDWCWWYGPEHDSANRTEFDELYRQHLANVYRALDLPPPEELSRPILKAAGAEFRLAPAGPVRATIDGDVTSYFEWLGAGSYRVDGRSGAMHGKRHLIREVFFGSDGLNLYLRVDFEQSVAGMEAHLTVESCVAHPASSALALRLERGSAVPVDLRLAAPSESGREPAEFAFDKVLELRMSLVALGVGFGQPLRFQLSLWQDGLPMDAIPQQGWLEVSTAEPTEWPL